MFKICLFVVFFLVGFSVASTKNTTYAWLEMQPMPAMLCSSAAVMLTSPSGTDYVFVIGGQTNVGLSSKVYSMNLETSQWDDGNVFAELPMGIQGSGAVVIGNRIYLVGGCLDTGACVVSIDNVYSYTPFEGEMGWVVEPSLPFPSSYPATIAFGGKIYNFYGLNTGTSVQIFSPNSNKWSATNASNPNLLDAWFQSPVVVGNNIWLVGGPPTTDSTWIYSPPTNKFVEGPNLVNSCWETAAALLDGSIYAICAAGSQENTGIQVCDNPMSPSADFVLLTRTSPQLISGSAQVVINNSTLLLIGGFTPFGSPFYDGTNNVTAFTIIP